MSFISLAKIAKRPLSSMVHGTTRSRRELAAFGRNAWGNQACPLFNLKYPLGTHGFSTSSSAFQASERQSSQTHEAHSEGPASAVIIENSKQMTDLIIHQCLPESGGLQAAGLKYLLRQLTDMREKSPTRMLTLARMSLKAPPSFKWFCNWLWPLMNGITPIQEAFPVSIEVKLFLPANASHQATAERLQSSLRALDAKRDELFNRSEWSGRRKPSTELVATNAADPYGYVQGLFGRVPIDTLENLNSTIQSFHSGEMEQYAFVSKIKKLSAMHSETLKPLILQCGIENDQYLDRYMQTSVKKNRDFTKSIQQAMDFLLTQVQVEEQERLQASGKDPRADYKEKKQIMLKEREERRKFGTNHEWYVTLHVERTRDFDFGTSARLSKEMRSRRTGHFVDIAQPSRSQLANDVFSEGEEGGGQGLGLGHASSSSIAATAARAGADAVDEAELSDDDDLVSPQRKIFLDNVPDTSDERDIALTLRNCGDVRRIWLFKSETESSGSNFGAVGRRSSFFREEFSKEEEDKSTQQGRAETYYARQKALAAKRGPVVEENAFYHPVDTEADKHAKQLNTVLFEDNGNDADKLMRESSTAVDPDDVSGAKSKKMKMKSKSKSKSKKTAASSLVEDAGEDSDSDSDSDGSSVSLVEDGSIITDVEEDAADSDSSVGDRLVEVTSLKEAVALEIEAEQSQKRKQLTKKTAKLKKQVARTKRNFNYAYVQLADDFGYQRATRDEMRIFGISIDGHACRVQEAARLRTLIVEVIAPLDCDMIRSTLMSLLGPWHSLNLPQYAPSRGNSQKQVMWSDVASKKPAFIHLEFESHEEAWKGFQVLKRASRDDNPVVSVSWIKSQLYWKVARKAKEMAFDSKSKKQPVHSAHVALGGASDGDGDGAEEGEGEGEVESEAEAEAEGEGEGEGEGEDESAGSNNGSR